MKKQKGYNSIFFLTTLSVYFGLLLVGTSPSVLAQQVILTSKFDVQKEVESEDDLDKNPEDEGLDQYFLIRLDNALNAFVEDLRKLRRQGKYNFRGKEEIIGGCTHTFCSDKIVDATSTYIDSWVATEFENLRKNLDVGADREDSQVPKFVERLNGEQGTLSCKDFGLEFLIDSTTFQVKISFSQDSSNKAFSTVSNLNTLFANRAASATKDSSRKFYQNTTAKYENNQVFVITRLPRGSLDALVRAGR